MSADGRHRGLGRGLSALMADAEVGSPTPASERRDVRRVQIDRIEANPDQPRRRFDDAALADLAASIREKGVIQPLLVRPHPERPDHFQIVAGERRWRAAQKASQHELPVIVRDFDDREVLEVAIIENVQRTDLNPIEEAAGYRQLVERFGHTQEKLAQALGKSRSHIANLLRLLNLPEDVQRMLTEGRLSAGHARALITADDPAGLAQQIEARGLSVRETEKLVKSAAVPQRQPSRRPEKDADTRALESDLAAATGLRVSIDHKPDGAGTIAIRYRSLEELDDLCRRIANA